MHKNSLFSSFYKKLVEWKSGTVVFFTFKSINKYEVFFKFVGINKYKVFFKFMGINK